MNKLAQIATVVFVSIFISACSQESTPDPVLETSEVKISEHAAEDAQALADAAKAKAEEMKKIADEKTKAVVEKAKEMAAATEDEVKDAVETAKAMAQEASDESGMSDKVEEAKGLLNTFGQ